jgi:hypothetical protein
MKQIKKKPLSFFIYLLPVLTVLFMSACSKPEADSAQSISGEFNQKAALELLYGHYDNTIKAAIWKDAVIPSDLPFKDNVFLNDPMFVTTEKTFNFIENSESKQILITSAMASLDVENQQGKGLLGAAVFVKKGAEWVVESNEPYLAAIEKRGTHDDFKWVRAGTDSYGLVIDEIGMGPQGAAVATSGVFIRGKDGDFSQVIPYDSENSGTSLCDIAGKTTFVHGKNLNHYDIKVSFRYYIPKHPEYIENHVYQYVNGKYVLSTADSTPDNFYELCISP